MATGCILTLNTDIVDSSETSLTNSRIKFVKCQKTVLFTSPAFLFQILQVGNLTS
jgi:hypothetical protein